MTYHAGEREQGGDLKTALDLARGNQAGADPRAKGVWPGITAPRSLDLDKGHSERGGDVSLSERDLEGVGGGGGTQTMQTFFEGIF